MKPIRQSVLLLICCISSASWGAEPAKPDSGSQVSAIAVPVPAATIAPQVPIDKTTSALKEEITALKAQTAEMRRSEDRLLSTMHWALALVGSFVLLVTGVSVYNAKTLHERDIKSVRDSVKGELGERLGSMVADARQQLEEPMRQGDLRLDAELKAFTMWKVGELRLKTGDINGAIDAGNEVVSSSKTFGLNYVPHAMVLITQALNAAIEKNVTLVESKVADIETGLPPKYRVNNIEYWVALKEALGKYEKLAK